MELPRAGSIRQQGTRGHRLGVVLAVAGLAGMATVLAQSEPPAEVTRSVRLETQRISIERVPASDDVLIARFRIMAGEYRGGMVTFVCTDSFPVQLERWDIHDESGYRRIGGAEVNDPAAGQWDELLHRGSDESADTLTLTLVQHDLDEREKSVRWHFTRLESISAPDRGD